MGCRCQSRMLERLCDAHTPLNSHGATQEERSQAKEDHAGPEEFAKNLRGATCFPACCSLPPESSKMQVQGECAGDQMTNQVTQKQRSCQQQKWRLGLVVEAGVGGRDDGQANQVGEDPEGHGEVGQPEAWCGKRRGRCGV